MNRSNILCREWKCNAFHGMKEDRWVWNIMKFDQILLSLWIEAMTVMLLVSCSFLETKIWIDNVNSCICFGFIFLFVSIILAMNRLETQWHLKFSPYLLVHVCRNGQTACGHWFRTLERITCVRWRAWESSECHQIYIRANISRSSRHLKDFMKYSKPASVFQSNYLYKPITTRKTLLKKKKYILGWSQSAEKSFCINKQKSCLQ